jgi:hypothetical protein
MFGEILQGERYINRGWSEHLSSVLFRMDSTNSFSFADLMDSLMSQSLFDSDPMWTNWPNATARPEPIPSGELSHDPQTL